MKQLDNLENQTKLADIDNINDSEMLLTGNSFPVDDLNFVALKDIVSSENEPDIIISSVNNNSNSDDNTEPTATKKEIKIPFIPGISHNFNKSRNNTYNNELDEYLGTIQSIDDNKGEFSAVLTNTNNKTIKAVFMIDDIQFDSDKQLVQIGAPIIWQIGQETQLLSFDGVTKKGSKKNFSKIIFRRIKTLTTKEKEDAEQKGAEWTRFFKQYATSSKTE